MNHRIRINLLLIMIPFAACSIKEKTNSAQEPADKLELEHLDAFHLLLAEAYHPYTETESLLTAKNLAAKLATVAEECASMALPDKLDSQEMITLINNLKVDSRSFAELVAINASDEEIAAALIALHGSFHSIMEEWNAGEQYLHH